MITERPRCLGRRASWALVGLLISLFSSRGIAQESPAPANRPAFVQRSESELLLFDLRLGQTILVEGMPAYPVVGGVVVPLGEVCRALDFAITVDVATGIAEGFFISENRRFSLDVASRKVTVEGEPRRFDPARIEIHQDDIYVETQLLSEWFPFDSTADPATLLLTIRPREALPVQKRQERERRAEKELSALGYQGARYPLIANPYRLIDFPFIDQTLRARVARVDGSSVSDLQFSTFLTGDFLFHEADIYLFGTQHGITDTRVTLGRRDPGAGLLGPLRSQEYAAGDVLDPGLEAISPPHSGPGFLLSNFPLQRQSQVDRHTFRGDLPQGWEVELYRNGALIAFQQSRPDGLYEFDNVLLVFGLNVFRLVFYGPQGQRREESSRFNVAESLTPPGQLFYRLVGNDPKDATRRGQLDLDYGLSRHFSASADLATVEIESVRHDYARAGLRGYSRLLFADVEIVVDRQGGSVATAGVQTRLGDVGLSLRHSQLQDDFESETFRPLYGLIRSRTIFHLDMTIPSGPLPSIPMTADFTRDRLESGQDVDHVAARMSSFYRGFALSNLIDWTFSTGQPRPLDPTAIGDLLVSKFVRGYGFRGEIIYDLQPRTDVASAAFTAEKSFPAYFVQAGISRAFRTEQTHYLASVTRSEGPFGFGLNLDYAHPGGLAISLTLNASVARDPRSGRWRSQARSLAGLGAVSPSVFLDANGNGVRDSDERPMESVGFFANRASTDAKTSEKGTAFVTGLPPYQEVDVAVAASTLEDPLAVAERPGVRFVPRPGRATEVEFPILISGEITGTVRVEREGGRREAAGVVVELVNSEGKVAKQTRTAYDGFYDLTLIVPGEYDIRVSPSQAERLKLTLDVSRHVSVAPSGTILDGIDLLLKEDKLHGEIR